MKANVWRLNSQKRQNDSKVFPNSFDSASLCSSPHNQYLFYTQLSKIKNKNKTCALFMRLLVPLNCVKVHFRVDQSDCQHPSLAAFWSDVTKPIFPHYTDLCRNVFFLKTFTSNFSEPRLKLLPDFCRANSRKYTDHHQAIHLGRITLQYPLSVIHTI